MPRRDADITVRPAREGDFVALAEFLLSAPRPPGAAAPPLGVEPGPLSHYLVVFGRGQIAGAVRLVPGAGRTASVSPPVLGEWDEGLAVRLLRAAAVRAARRHGARLIQAVLAPEGAEPAVAALEAAGFAPLATLVHMRRSVGPDDGDLPLPDGLQWQAYSSWRHRRFAETVRATYRDSLDCPPLAGLRTVHDALRTHRHTGRFSPKTWHLAVRGREPVGVVLVNALRDRAELVYLGLVPEARGQGLGRALVHRAVRSAVEMGTRRLGLAADAGNEPALRLYRRTGFQESHRRLAYFVPAERLAELTG